MSLSLMPERAAVDRVVDALIPNIAAGQAIAMARIMRDDTISPDSLLLGMIEAHARGVAAAMVSQPDAAADEALLRQVMDIIRADVAEGRKAQ